MPHSRPICLRPMLMAKEYQLLAEWITKEMAWKSYLEHFVHYCLKFLFPHWSVDWMVSEIYLLCFIAHLVAPWFF